MVRCGHENGGRARKGQAGPFDFDVLHTEEEHGEEEILAALMEADAADSGVPQTRASRMQTEMAALERWLIENEELHEAERGESICSSPTAIDEDGNDDKNDDDDALPVLAVCTSSGDPWLSHDSSAPPIIQRGGATAGFDDDFSAFVSAPAVSISTAAAASTPASAFAPTAAVAHDLLSLSAPMLLPSHTGGSYRSLRSGTSGFASDLEDHGGYEALGDSNSFFSPEHEFDAADVGADPRTSVGRGFGSEHAHHVPFDLTNILSSLETMREGVAGIEDEVQRRAATARFASEFVFRRMDTDGDER